jgi:hypothetical protein
MVIDASSYCKEDAPGWIAKVDRFLKVLYRIEIVGDSSQFV